MGFWLPTEFLDDGELLGVQEMNSEEEDFVGNFSVQMTQPFHLEDDKVNRQSPPSTFFEVRNLSHMAAAPSCKNPMVPTAFDHLDARYSDDDAVAAGEVSGLRLTKEQERRWNRDKLSNSKEVAVAVTQSFPHSGSFLGHSPTLQKNQFQQQSALCGKHNGAIRGAAAAGMHAATSHPMKQNHHHHQLRQVGSGSGMLAFFLNSSGKTSSAGTGVFLPNSDAGERKKTRCSTVLVPVRVVQALKLNPQELALHPRFTGCYLFDGGAFHVSPAMDRRSDARLNKNIRPHPVAAAAAAAEICLPTEWTY